MDVLIVTVALQALQFLGELQRLRGVKTARIPNLEGTALVISHFDRQ